MAATWLRALRGSLYCALLLGSILSGWLMLCCPLLPLLFFRSRAYRSGIDTIFAMWELYPAALMRFLLGVRLIVTGDPVQGFERSILVMNHRTRLDWNFLWGGLQRAAQPGCTRLKFVLKAPIAHVPGPGWVMQMACHLYIHRSWDRDQNLLTEFLKFFRDIDHTCQILLFPEGTDLTERSRVRSNDYADSHKLPHFDYVLHPKTTGFVFIASKLRQYNMLDAVYDVTVAYPRTLVQNEAELMSGKIPEEIHFHFKRYDLSDLPTTEQTLKTWLQNKWIEKEKKLREFYSNGHFDKCVTDNWDQDSQKPSDTGLCLALCFWTALVISTVWLLLFSSVVQLYALVHVLVFISLSFCGTGAHHVEINLHRFRNR